MIVAYLKISDFCNLGCDHCYLPISARKDKSVMGDDVLKKAVNDLGVLAKKSNSGCVNVVWHGGEPMLVNPQLFIEYINFIKSSLISDGIDVVFSMQTSLIPLNQKWVEIIKKYFDGSIGVSVDFSARRVSESVERYFKVLEKRLKMCSKEGINVNATVVVTQSELGKADELVEWFVAKGIFDVDFTRFNSYSVVAKNRPTNREHAIFLSDIIDVLIQRYKKGEVCPRVQSVDDAVMVAIGRESSGVWGGGCLKGNYVVNPNGKTNYCPDRISYDKSFTENGTQFLDSIELAKSVVEYNTRMANRSCINCEYQIACRGGCPIGNNSLLENGDCSGFKTLLDYICGVYKSDPIAKECMDMVLKNGK